MFDGQLLKPKAIVLLLATIVLSGFAAADAWVNVIHRRLPESALAVDPNDPVALVRAAQLKVANGLRPDEDVSEIARRSVDGLPLNAPAFRLFGLVSSADADIATIRRRMALSDRLSRRDIGAQLWLIEDAVVRNNVADALRHYDTALRVKESSKDLLYPVLTAALKEPVIRRRFIPYMNAENPWLQSFIAYALAHTDQPVAIADLARQAHGFPPGAEFAAFDTQLLRILVEQGEFTEAVAHYKRMAEGDPALLTTLDLTDTSTAENLAPVSWQPFSIAGIDPMIVGVGDDRVEIESTLTPGYSGPFARKMMSLEPGRFEARFQLRGEGFSARDRLLVRFECAGSSAGRSPLLDFETRQTAAIDETHGFVVAQDCPVQMLTISVRSGYSGGSKTLTLAQASLRKLGSSTPPQPKDR